MQNNEQSQSPNIEENAVSVKILPFSVDRPDMWFYQFEVQFQILGITLEETKFNYLLTQLEPSHYKII